MMGNMGMGNPFAPQTGAAGAAGAAAWTCVVRNESTPAGSAPSAARQKPDETGAQAAAAPSNVQWTCECGKVNTASSVPNAASRNLL
jgi:membrane protease subunit (stomatin/prohibitin family)